MVLNRPTSLPLACDRAGHGKRFPNDGLDRQRPRRDVVVKQDRARRTHTLLLDAAAKEFVRHGYTGANLQRVAQQASMTKGALYAHFPSKEALATALTAPFEQTWRELLHRAETAGPAAEGVLSDLVVALVTRLRTDLRFRAGFHLTAENARAEQRLPPVVEELTRALPGLVRQAQERGEVCPTRTPEALSSLLLTLICGVYYTTAQCEPDTCPAEMAAIWHLVPGSAPPDPGGEDFGATPPQGPARTGCQGPPVTARE
ncbi:TetR/AcrR family transcriptional regulator [Streptomyces sp. NPDC091267]|uniref:TetR/AcrR family transcriptional regulator n=1 Tax=Streptomyces sp. NPDC091267 TaxID=3155195 RepID=UPI00343317D2